MGNEYAIWMMLNDDYERRERRRREEEESRVDHSYDELVAIERKKQYEKKLKEIIDRKYGTLKLLAQGNKNEFEDLYVETFNKIAKFINKQNLELKISDVAYPNGERAKENAILFNGCINFLSQYYWLKWSKKCAEKRLKEYESEVERLGNMPNEKKLLVEELENTSKINVYKQMALRSKIKDLNKKIDWDHREYYKDQYERANNKFEEGKKNFEVIKPLLLEVETLSILNNSIEKFSKETINKIEKVLIESESENREVLTLLASGYNLFEFERDFADNKNVYDWQGEVCWGHAMEEEEIENFNKELDKQLQNRIINKVKKNQNKNSETILKEMEMTLEK